MSIVTPPQQDSPRTSHPSFSSFNNEKHFHAQADNPSFFSFNEKHFHGQADNPSFSSFRNETNFHDEIDLSYPYPAKEPYFPTVFGTFRIQQNNKHRNVVDITSDFSLKQSGYAPQFQHSSASFPQAMSLLGQDIEYWANHTE